jgi:uncharacterized membrane protein YoaK (UPF0700 family)
MYRAPDNEHAIRGARTNEGESAVNAVARATPVKAPAEPRVQPIALAFTAGFVDTLGFVALFSFFTAHVTGNFVVLGSALTEPLHGLVAKVLALPMFIIAVGAARLYGRSLDRRGVAAARRFLALEAVFLAVFMTLGLLAAPLTNGDSPMAVITALSGVVAMGIQNAASRTVFANLSPTTVMTGNVTQLVIDCVDLLAGVPVADAPQLRARIRRFWPPVVAFAFGAACGALGYRSAGFLSLLLPTTIVLALSMRAPAKALE